MIDELPTPALIAHAKGNDATELELELADRLEAAIHEIEQLAQTVRALEQANDA